MKKTFKRIALGFAAAAMVTIMAGCSSSAKAKGNSASGNTIKVGVNMELSGSTAGYGEQEKKGIELAFEKINKAGGVKVKGKKMKLKPVYRDNKSSTTSAASVAAQLVNNDKVVAVVGPATTNDSTAAIPNVTKASVPMITPSATDAGYTLQKNGKVQPYAFRACFTDSFQATAAAKFAYNTLKVKKVAILADNASDYGTGLTKAFKKTFKGDVVSTQYFQAGDKDFNATLTSLKNKKFDALYVPGYYSEVGLIIKQARQMGIKTPIIGADGMGDPSLPKIAGSNNATNVYYSTPFSTKSADTNTTVKNFMADYKQKFNAEAPTFSALAYDSVYMVKAAIEKANSTNSVDIAKALGKLKNMKGVTGTMSIDSKHNPEKTVSIEQMTNGQIVKAYSVK
ncbi:ABC transporter substrate-binding protein [Lacticaseibacillus thailandensis]|uniref:LivA protein n=1 Tax=Lacticaseibacillus thailandensis DSM 22698 = JCM 13996 TaxID=1423810 RepID=A0A0R2C6D2_9LACO|nr:ABC transporter substrate-binding protein [Lacticaseibacillus thailandensis]KRM87246.1 livA protein [Lacticaseibacillus thailandensis DSM 22698 = JCM 13996]